MTRLAGLHERPKMRRLPRVRLLERSFEFAASPNKQRRLPYLDRVGPGKEQKLIFARIDAQSKEFLITSYRQRARVGASANSAFHRRIKFHEIFPFSVAGRSETAHAAIS